MAGLDFCSRWKLEAQKKKVNVTMSLSALSTLGQWGRTDVRLLLVVDLLTSDQWTVTGYCYKVTLETFWILRNTKIIINISKKK